MRCFFYLELVRKIIEYFDKLNKKEIEKGCHIKRWETKHYNKWIFKSME